MSVQTFWILYGLGAFASLMISGAALAAKHQEGGGPSLVGILVAMWVWPIFVPLMLGSMLYLLLVPERESTSGD